MSDDSTMEKEETQEVIEKKDENDNNTVQSRETSVKEPGETYANIMKGNPIYEDVTQILLWKDPTRSGILFGIVNLFYFLITWGEYTLLTLFSYLFLTLLLNCFFYANYVVLKASWLQGKRVENPLKERFKNAKFHISRQHVDKHVDTFIRFVNHTIDLVRDAFYCTDNLLTLKIALYFYLLAQLGNVFLDSTLLYLVSLAYFIWPRLYLEKHKEIDQVYDIAYQQAKVYIELGLSKLPPAITNKLAALKVKQN